MIALEFLLFNSDFILINCGLNPASRHLMNTDTSVLMKSNAVLINTVCGLIVDEKSLIEALQTKFLAGAVLELDAFDQVLLPLESLFMKTDDVMLAPVTPLSALDMRKSSLEHDQDFTGGLEISTDGGIENAYA